MQKYIKFVLYLIIVVLVNLIAFSSFQRWDLTRNDVYSLSDVSQTALTELTDPLTINVFFSANLPAPYNGIETYLKDLMAEYALTANRYFKYNFYNVTAQEGELSEEARENQLLAANYGIEPVQIQAVENDEVKFQRVFMGLVVVYGDQIIKIDPVSTTDGLEYRLTSAILKLSRKINTLATLDNKIHIDFYLSPNIKDVAQVLRIEPKQFDDVVTDLERMMTKLNAMSFNKLEYTYHELHNTQRDLEIAEKYDILVMEWPAIPQLNIKEDFGIIGLSIRYKDTQVALPVLNMVEVPNYGMAYFLTDGYALEMEISAAIDSVTQVNDAVGYLADHGNPLHQSLGQPGMPEPDDSIMTFGDLVNQNYHLKDVFMNKPGAMQGTQTMIIVKPTRPFTDYELFQLDQYLMQGNSLMLVTDQFIDVANLEPPMNPMMRNRPMFMPRQTGLEKLLAHYAGVTVDDAVILDKNCWRQPLPAEMGGGDRPIYMAPMLKQDRINNTPAYMHNLPALVFLKVSPITVDLEYAATQGVKVTELLRSSDESWLLRNVIDFNPSNIPGPAEDQQYTSYPFSYMLEGEFVSYFADKEIPVDQRPEEQPQIDEEGNPTVPEEEAGPDIKVRDNFTAKGKPGKIFILTSSDALANNILDPEAQTPNAIFILNVLDYLNGQEEMAVMRSKTQAITLLDSSGAKTKTFAKYFNIAVVPILVIVAGIVVWFWRKNRQRSIRARFAVKKVEQS